MSQFVRRGSSILLCLSLAGCGAAPSLDILGSFFPSWMLCAVLGIVLTAVTHQIFVKRGLHEQLPMKPLVYIGLVISFTLLIWLVVFGL